MKSLITSNGVEVVVDDDVFEWASKRSWFARLDKQISWYIVGTDLTTNKPCYLHREIMGFPNAKVDHKNRNGLDCRIENLRIATTNQSSANRGKKRNALSSKYKGVYWSKQKMRWAVDIGRSSGKRMVRLFKNEEKAARFYDSEALKIWGEFAFQNFP